MPLDLGFLAEWGGFVARGFLITLEMTAIGLAGGFVLGSALALGDVYGGRILRILVNAYVEFFRGSPLLVQLLFFYYGIPALTGIHWDSYTAGAVTLILNSAAYQKGYIKGAIESVPKDQILAAKALGMTNRQILAHIVLPQAYRIVIPAWTNELVALGKSTAALLIIGVGELTSAAMTISALTFRPLETYTAVAAIYFAWIYLSLKLTEHVYRRVRIPGLGEGL
ncbi:MAG: amino acid ABC transporter permease [Thermoproteota archaeon]